MLWWPLWRSLSLNQYTVHRYSTRVVLVRFTSSLFTPVSPAPLLRLGYLAYSFPFALSVVFSPQRRAPECLYYENYHARPTFPLSPPDILKLKSTVNFLEKKTDVSASKPLVCLHHHVKRAQSYHTNFERCFE